MAIKHMALVNILGPKEKIDNVVEKYIINKNVHLEDSITIAGGVEGLYRFDTANPYLPLYKRCVEVSTMLSVPLKYLPVEHSYTSEQANSYLEKVEQEFGAIRSARMSIEAIINDNTRLQNQLRYMLNLDISLHDMFNLEFMRFRFGRMTKENYTKLTTFLSDVEAYFIEGETDGNYVYGIYLTPHKIAKKKIDEIFASLNFERIRISDKAQGNPKDAYLSLEVENKKLKEQLVKVQKQSNEYIEKEKTRLLELYSYAKMKFRVFEVRETSSHTMDSFYISGWIPVSDAKKLARQLGKEQDLIVVMEQPEAVENSTPPTLLRNHPLVKPFETLVKMYGLPSYDEIDPTMLFAITYVFMFGMMFGDAGQGLILAIAGFLMYKLKRIDLGAVIGWAGVSAMIFGTLYGSVFGNEDLIKGLWMRPIDNADSILYAAIYTGMIMIVTAMVLNIINAIKVKDLGRLWFGHNGAAGLFMYGGGIGSAFLLAKGFIIPIWAIVIFVLVIPFIIIFLKEPLEKLVEGKKKWLPENIGEYITETFFEMFEILLGFVTNTISFVRIGAFVLIHIGMMMVVYQLAGKPGSVSSIIALILGNLFVMGMEGFLVGIQTLRLEFYELFSRFFRGEGRAFSPLNINNDNKNN